MAKKIHADINDVLNIRFVEWRAVSSYITDLEDILEEIMTLADKKPVEALGLIRHFVEEIPKIFDSVHDEWELGLFCEDLANSALALTKKARVPLQETGSWLLKAFVDDLTNTCRFNEVPELLEEFRWPKQERLMFAGIANQLALSSKNGASELRTLAEKLAQPVWKIHKR